MMKRIFLLASILALALSITAHASSPRAVLVLPSLSFSGTTATCTVRINGNVASDTISAAIELRNGNTCVDSWTVSGIGYVYFVETAGVSVGKEYTLAVDAVVNGKAYPTATISKICS